MKHSDPTNPEFAFLRPGTPMFPEVIDRLRGAADLPPSRRRDMISGLRRIARALGRPPEEVPADPKWLQPRLAKVAPAALGITGKSWSNTVSNARAALTLCGLPAGPSSRRRRKSDLSSRWQQLWGAVLASGDMGLRTSLCRFVHFLNARGIEPADVRDADADAYRQALEAAALLKSPYWSWRAAVNGWNLAHDRLSDWPRSRLALPMPKRIIRVPGHELPESFQADLRRFLDRLQNPDRFDSSAPARASRPATVAGYRHCILQFAGELVQAGVARDEITNLAVLCTPAMVKRGLRNMRQRMGNKNTCGVFHMATQLHFIARNYCNLGEDDCKMLALYTSRLRPDNPYSMSSKNWGRLGAVEGDDALLRRLLQLPERIVRLAANKPPYKRALAIEDALAIAILTYCPIRLRNLSEIRPEQNIRRQTSGETWLVFDQSEVKNRRGLDHPLPEDVLDLIELHLRARLPVLCPPGVPWLFPSRDGSRPILAGQLGIRVKERIRRELGLEFNAHLFRHLAAALSLQERPNSYDSVRRLLGHSSTSHTINLYTGLETREVTRAFARIIADRKGPPR